MEERTLLDSLSIETQSIEAVENLSRYLNREIENGVLDMGRIKLVLSGDKKSFYATTATDCSCPAKHWHPGRPCKHQRRHFSAPNGKETLLIDAVAWQPTEGELRYWKDKKAKLQKQKDQELSPTQRFAADIVASWG